MNRSPITSHVLDTSTGKPATNVPVRLYQLTANELATNTTESWQLIAEGSTDDDGRLIDWLPAEQEISHGTYKLFFDIDAYAAINGSVEATFYPYAEICFRVQDDNHHHIPLLLSAFGYSTYRGS